MLFHQKMKWILLICSAAAFGVAGGSSRRVSDAMRSGPAFIGTIKPNIQGATKLHLERSYSSDLDTAYEWLSYEPERRGKIKWFHPDDATADENEYGDDDEIKKMPLYPLGAVHIPHSGENHTLVNIEKRNVRMATVREEHLIHNFISCVHFTCTRLRLHIMRPTPHTAAIMLRMKGSHERRMGKRSILCQSSSTGHQPHRNCGYSDAAT